MSGAHTPGPWTIETVRTSVGLCHKVGPFPYKVGKINHACIYDDRPELGNVGTPELVANARLISAAPDLLAAAKRALVTLKAQGESVRPGNVLGALEAAIAKAGA